MPRCSLITGVSGFIGNRLAQRIRERGQRVYGVDIAPSQACCDVPIKADVTRPLSVDPFAGVDTVFHLAGKVHALSEVKQDDTEYFQVNTDGTRHVLEAARSIGVRRFVFFSTVKAMSRDEANSVAQGAKSQGQEPKKEPQRKEFRDKRSRGGEQWLGGIQARAWAEEDVIEPDTPYGKSKLEAEKLVLNGGYVPEPVVLRLCMVYGAGAKGNMTKMLRAIDRGLFPLLPETRNRRSMVHVHDVLEAALLAAQRSEAVGQVFIVSDGVEYSTRQMFELMCHALNRPVPSWTVPLWVLRSLGWTGDAIGQLRGRRFFFDSDALATLTGSAWFSSRKIETMLGFKPEWNLEKALPEMVEEMRSAQRITRRTDEG